jgi:hypothetical protein
MVLDCFRSSHAIFVLNYLLEISKTLSKVPKTCRKVFPWENSFVIYTGELIPTIVSLFKLYPTFLSFTKLCYTSFPTKTFSIILFPLKIWKEKLRNSVFHLKISIFSCIPVLNLHTTVSISVFSQSFYILFAFCQLNFIISLILLVSFLFFLFLPPTFWYFWHFYFSLLLSFCYFSSVSRSNIINGELKASARNFGIAFSIKPRSESNNETLKYFLPTFEPEWSNFSLINKTLVYSWNKYNNF